MIVDERKMKGGGGEKKKGKKKNFIRETRILADRRIAHNARLRVGGARRRRRGKGGEEGLLKRIISTAV